MRYVIAAYAAGVFALPAAWCRLTAPEYRHVRVIPAPYDWAKDEEPNGQG